MRRAVRQRELSMHARYWRQGGCGIKRGERNSWSAGFSSRTVGHCQAFRNSLLLARGSRATEAHAIRDRSFAASGESAKASNTWVDVYLSWIC